jgi:hypothetical protein
MFKRPIFPPEARLQAQRVLGYDALEVHDLIESFLRSEAALNQALAQAVTAGAEPPVVDSPSTPPARRKQRRKAA